MLLLLLACQPAGTGVGVVKHDTGDTGFNHSGSTTFDTADTDGDMDDDGFTPEEGDCDDDNIRVSPGRDEVVGDGLDNDCDGRIDEQFAGVAVAWDNGSGSSSILSIDAVGREDELVVKNDCYPLWIGQHGDGWAINNGQASVALVDSAGNCSDIADFSDPEVYEYGVWGITTTPDGIIYATTVDALYQIDDDGTLHELARWVVDFEDITKHEAAITGLAYDAATHTVGLFDFFGGFATWNETDGLVMRLHGDPGAPVLTGFAGSAQDGGDWLYLAGSSETGAYGIYRFDTATQDWVQRDTWTDLGYAPNLMAIDSDSGDAYVTANGGWYATVWRVVANTSYAADLFSTDGTEEGRPFFGIVTLYE